MRALAFPKPSGTPSSAPEQAASELHRQEFVERTNRSKNANRWESLELLDAFLKMALTAAGSVVAMIVVLRTPHASPLAVVGLSVGSGLAVGYQAWRYWRDRNDPPKNSPASGG